MALTIKQMQDIKTELVTTIHSNRLVEQRLDDEEDQLKINLVKFNAAREIFTSEREKFKQKIRLFKKLDKKLGKSLDEKETEEVRMDKAHSKKKRPKKESDRAEVLEAEEVEELEEYEELEEVEEDDTDSSSDKESYVDWD